MARSWGIKAIDGTAHPAEARGDEDGLRSEASWFDSSWELRKGLVVAELTEADDLPAEWLGAPSR